MKKFFINTFLVVLLVLPLVPVFSQEVSSDNKTEMPPDNQHDTIVQEDYEKQLIRVGISTNDFKHLEYKQVKLTADNAFDVYDKLNNELLATSNGKEIFKAVMNGKSFILYRNGKVIAREITGPLSIKTKDGSPIKIVGLYRKKKPAYYRGEIEIIRAPKKSNKLSAVNILPLRQYLRGVVPNELPVSFGLEALKAQAVAARNYAIRPRIKTHSQFDICDSVQCQVYFGYNTEDELSDQAIAETEGLIGLYDGEVILAMYSSAAGGYTESYENSFIKPWGEKPTKYPYLVGVPDYPMEQDLSKFKKAKKFYTTKPKSFDEKSRYFRWQRVWTKAQMQRKLNKRLAKFSKTGFIKPKVREGECIGNIKRIDIIDRGVSGVAKEVRIKTSKRNYHVRKELIIRKLFIHNGKNLPSASMVFINRFDKNKNLIDITAYGGGLGHGVGMSQYGASYMSKNGYKFNEILQHYYTGIALGTQPIIITSSTGAKPFLQKFYTPEGKASLMLDNLDGVKSIKVKINDTELAFSKEEMKENDYKINIDKYLGKGLNKIIFYPLEKQDEGLCLKAWVEVFES